MIINYARKSLKDKSSLGLHCDSMHSVNEHQYQHGGVSVTSEKYSVGLVFYVYKFYEDVLVE